MTLPTFSDEQLHDAAVVPVGLALGALQARGLYVAFASRTWSTVPGRARKAVLEPLRKTIGGEIAHVHYAYKVGARSCTGWRVRFGMLSTSLSEAEQVSEYRQFRDVTVHYNPDDPDQAVLEPGPKLSQWIGFAPSAAIVAFGCWRLRYR